MTFVALHVVVVVEGRRIDGNVGRSGLCDGRCQMIGLLMDVGNRVEIRKLDEEDDDDGDNDCDDCHCFKEDQRA